MKRPKHCHIILALLMLLTITGTTPLVEKSFAADSLSDQPQQEEVLPVMPSIEVEAARIAPTIGSALLDKELVDNLPTRNGTVDETISIVPGVQLSESNNSSFTAGEITSPGVSISGSLPFENNYTIDGLSNNSMLDPANDTIGDASKLPGHPQNHLIPTRIIEQIKVYNSNIPAEFGGFVGGQVESKTIDPTQNFWGTANYRTTRDKWTNFYISPDDEEDFNNSNNQRFQPYFEKHDAGLILNLPINQRTGVITSYQQIKSEIPLKHLDGSKTQARKRENVLLKLVNDPTHSTRLSITGLWSPSRGDYFLNDTKNSDYRLTSDTYSLIFNSETLFDAGQLNMTIGFTGQTNKRSGSGDRFRWNDETPSIDWEGGFIGNQGQLKTEQKEFSLRADYLVAPFQVKTTNHQVKLGVDTKFATQSYLRPSDHNYYFYVGDKTGAISCEPNDPACIENEQYLNRRTKYLSGKSDISNHNLALYVQDSILWKRLELFPGVRTSYNSLSDQINVAPRFSTSLDLFGNRGTILFAGKNRYYSGTLHTFGLYKAINFERQKRNTPEVDAWETTSKSTIRIESKTRTPYTDELTVGIIQKLLGGEFKFQYIDRTTKDGLVRSLNEDKTAYSLENHGRTEHESYLVRWQRAWKKHFLEINSTWQETTTNYTSYETNLDEDDLNKTIWYEGKEYFIYEIPRKDFNRPVVANLIYSGHLPYGFIFTNVAKFRGPYTWLKNTGERKASLRNPEQESEPFVYEKKRHHSSLIFDWKISWRVPHYTERNAVLTLDIYNVFNRKTNYGAGTDDFELGRQYWAGLEFNF